ncbi:mitochondrial Complex I (CI) NADH:ubiquinone oxidoreductase subunit 42-kDa/NUDM/NDUFA10 [Andalucia godoyi]|uniref:Mitochondrial Complex I (CI) NADH:ubiquinone oxidoreductase subunit 42-kDa/NUDM/NDUFA10 n=1 Tax=Andalucia godoyi TaxID=505711 RepID=A0A8K0F2B1_ANDGO|nr:mitochondrial Complex I (CI) NADH:ubiquinone oxidoreductase subunit 42-kDa/NUDM/NDUFA10 [Andalucia godoyi]|eukprot:ANDGO_04312.mRNA.1 mitochondrial Complex I (CI) NADH:ubiquinone oxidoreductase subunit 42-kDa/NUDM/NDUFA10
MSKIIIIEGNISAGKSTLAKQLGSLLHYKVFYEPVVTNPFLEHFYGNPQKYALPMQLWFLKQRYETYLAALDMDLTSDGYNGVILDRSVFSDIVFAHKNRQDGNISEEGFDEYLTLRAKYLSSLPSPHAVVYLEVPAAVCYDRVHNLRKRDCESGIPLEYLAGLEKCYQDFLVSMHEEHGCGMVCKNWVNFGNAEQIAEDVKLALQNSKVQSNGSARYLKHKRSASNSISNARSSIGALVLEHKDDDERLPMGCSPVKG